MAIKYPLKFNMNQPQNRDSDDSNFWICDIARLTDFVVIASTSVCSDLIIFIFCLIVYFSTLFFVILLRRLRQRPLCSIINGDDADNDDDDYHIFLRSSYNFAIPLSSIFFHLLRFVSHLISFKLIFFSASQMWCILHDFCDAKLLVCYAHTQAQAQTHKQTRARSL